MITLNRKDAKALGMPAGSMIAYADAPGWLQHRHDSIHEPVPTASAKRIEEETDSALKFLDDARAALGLDRLHPEVA